MKKAVSPKTRNTKGDGRLTEAFYIVSRLFPPVKKGHKYEKKERNKI